MWVPMEEDEVVVKSNDIGLRIVQTFREYDANGDGSITRDELARALVALSPETFDDEKVDVLLKAFDSDGDGVIGYEEFIDFLTGKSAAGLADPESRSHMLEIEVLEPRRVEPVRPTTRESPTIAAYQSLAPGESWRDQPVHGSWRAMKKGEVEVLTKDIGTRIVSTFRQFDTDDNDSVTRDELAVILRTLDPKMWSKEKVDLLLSRMDADLDKGISYQEFVSFINGGTADSLADQESREFLLKAADWIAPKEGTSRGAAAILEDLPPPDSASPDDAEHVAHYLHDFVYRNCEGLGEAPANADRNVALHWLHSALERISEGQHEYKQPVKWLIANFRLWPDSKNPEERGFVALRDLALKKLDDIGLRYEQSVFVTRCLSDSLGDLGADIAAVRPRQDEYLPLPAHIATPEDGPWTLISPSMAYVALLLTAVHALDPYFQEAAQSICQAAGGACSAPKPKGLMRMVAKLIGDHVDAEVPKSAENIDTNRTAWTFQDPESFRQAFDGATAGFGPPLRVKNGYSADFDAMSISKGYRNILANYRYSPDGLTWGSLAREERTEDAWKKLRTSTVKQLVHLGDLDEDVAVKAEELSRCLDLAREHLLSEEMRDEPVVLVCEVQYMLQPYLEMRKYTHYWYKIVRANNSEVMAQDFSAS